MSDNPALAHPVLSRAIERGVSDLVDRPRLIGAAVARTVLARVAWESYQRGRADAVAELLTTDQVAAALGVTDRRVRQLAEKRDLGWAIGRDRLFRPEDVEAMRVKGSPGRPRKPAPETRPWTA